MITEVLMASGRWELTLREDTPRGLVDSLETWSTVCILPGRLDGPLTRAEVLAAARFSGILRSRSNDSRTLTGPSIAAWLGDEDGKGSEVTEGLSAFGDAMLVDLFDPTTNTNGLTLGSYGTITTGAIYQTMQPGEVARSFLDRVCRTLGWTYRVNPDGSVDFCDDDSIWRSGEVLIMESAPRQELAMTVLDGQISNTASNDDYATKIEVDDGTYDGSASTIGTPPKNFGGSDNAVIWKLVTSSDVGSDAEAAAQASTELLTNYSTKNLVEVSVDVDDPKRWIEPGDTVLVYDPLAGLETAVAADCLTIAGQPVYPLELAVAEMTWPITRGLGVYLIQNSDSEVVDLTDFVEPEDGLTQLQVGFRWPTLREAVQGRN